MALTGKLWGLEHRALIAKLAGAVAPGDGAEVGGDIAEIIAELVDLTRHGRHYLARSLDAEAQRACSKFHHLWMSERLTAVAFHALLQSHVEIWSAHLEGVRYSFRAYVEPYVSREGELSLELFANKKALYALSFTVVPARLFALGDGAVFLASRLQGRPNRFENIKLATKAMSEVSPRASLFAALAGIASAVGIDLVLGVSADNYLNFHADKREALERQYDAFFQTLEAAGPHGGFYTIDLRAEPKPVSAIKAGHRIRTRRKRQFKQQITQAVAQSWGALVAPPQSETAR